MLWEFGGWTSCQFSTGNEHKGNLESKDAKIGKLQAPLGNMEQASWPGRIGEALIGKQSSGKVGGRSMEPWAPFQIR